MRTHAAASADRILSHLEQVQRERASRQAAPGWGARVVRLKAYQQARFARTHADLLADRRYAAAAQFFLDDLYGPQDFGERDAQFVRIVPALVRLFPAEVVATVGALAELHALTESLDSDMARHLSVGDVTASGYRAAWQATGRRPEREHQIDLVLGLGRQLDQFTRSRLLRQSLRMMRGPARAAGLAALQAFLERGFDTFGAMGGASEFLARVQDRERALLQALFERPVTEATNPSSPLGQLP
jgi:hypothetical protein